MTVVIVAAYTDLRRGRVYNAVTFPAIALGLALNGVFWGSEGLADSFRAVALAFAFLIVPVALKGVGAGDLKLLAAVGALGGVKFLLFAFFYAALIVGAASVFILGYRRLAFLPLPVYISRGPAGVKALPFAVAVAIGCALAFYVR